MVEIVAEKRKFLRSLTRFKKAKTRKQTLLRKTHLQEGFQEDLHGQELVELLKVTLVV